MTNPKFCFDVWVIRQFDNDDMGNDHWSFVDTFAYLFKSEHYGNNDHIELHEMEEHVHHV